MSTPSCCSSSHVFEAGNHVVVLFRLEPEPSIASGPSSPPNPLLIATPSDGGEFPVLLFLHGYLLYNSFYSQLLRHIASHGFVVVAPQDSTVHEVLTTAASEEGKGQMYEAIPFRVERQVAMEQPYHCAKARKWRMYNVAGPDSSDEIKCAAATTDWLSLGLPHVLPTHVRPDLNKLGLAGHSRGGKVAFALALGLANTSLKFSALIGIDPVDGMDKGKQTNPPVLTYVPHSFHIKMAFLVIGSGLGELKKNPLFPPCAPKGVNHEDFFNECCPPAWYFVAEDYGHLDMLDDETKGFRGKASYCLCKNGKAREPMRRFVGGIVVAFMKAYLKDDSGDITAIREEPSIAPVELRPIGFLV